MGISSDVMIGTLSLGEPRGESSREERGDDKVVVASRGVGGADESYAADGGKLICMFDMPSLSVAVLKAFCILDDFSELASVVRVGFLAGNEDLIAGGLSTSSHITGLALNFGPLLGYSRRGCL